MLPFNRVLASIGMSAFVTSALLGQGGATQTEQWRLHLVPIESPAAARSAQPKLSLSKRGVLLSWIESTDTKAILKFAERTSTGWTQSTVVASGSDWFVNWADVPSVMRLDDGTLVAHWLQKNGRDTYAYDVRLAHSRDDGKTWSQSFLPHSDGSKTEHGFASLFQMPGAGLGLVWLDGRNMAEGGHMGHGDMTLRFGTFGKDWKQTAEIELDGRVCECCPTAAAVTADGPIVAYRDRGPDETRDIYITRLERGTWSAPKPVHADSWKVPACPVNGPGLSASGKQVAVAWFTAKDEEARAFAAFSSDAGRTFGTPIRLDDRGTLGRVDVELLPDGSAVGAYVEMVEKQAEFRVRRIWPDGRKSAPSTIAALVGTRSSGYPRMAFHDNELVFAWIERTGSAGSQVKIAVASLSGLMK